MKKVLVLLFCLLSICAFAQDTDNDLFISSSRTDFHPIFKSIDEMKGKHVRFDNVVYKDYIDYVFIKKGKRLVQFKGVGLPFKKYHTYFVEDIIQVDGDKYIQVLDEENNVSFYLRSPYSSLFCNTIYDIDEVNRMKQYTKEHFVYRKLRTGEKSYNKQPYDYLPYVEVGVSGVDIFRNKYTKEITASFYYFTEDGDRFVDYDLINLKAHDLLSESELAAKAEEAKEREIQRVKQWSDNHDKYGKKIADAIYNSTFWTESRVDDLIAAIGKEMAEYVVSGEVRIGMSKDLCELTWGTPDKINKTTYSFGVKEQWVYSKRNAYLYFEDGVLTAISENS